MQRYPVWQAEPVAGAEPTVEVGDSVESDQTSHAERCDGTCGAVLGGPHGGSNISYPQRGGPTLPVKVGGEGEFLQREPRQRAELASPVSALRTEE
jgi:hypothetical protein